MKIGLFFSILICLSVVAVCLVIVWSYSNLTKELPSTDTLPALLEPPVGKYLTPTRLFDRSYEHIILTLENPATTGRRYLQAGDEDQVDENHFPRYLIDATIIAFDPGFWKHSGYLIAGLFEGEHSTLAQRLISDLILIEEPVTLERNIRERLLAAQITNKFGRWKVLEWYLNSSQYGDLIYGADAAARAFFGKPADKLDLAEAAMLVAISKTPEISPKSGAQVLKQQQEQIILAMLGTELISVSDAQKAISEELHFQTIPETHPIAPAFTDLVLEQLSSKINLDRVTRGGYDIVTTLDYELQVQSRCATETQLARLQGDLESVVNIEETECVSARLLPNLQLNPEDQIQDLNANVIIIDPHSGQILSLVGDEIKTTVTPFLSEHTAGTIFSPFLYLTAFTRGLNPSSLLWDIPFDNGTDVSGSDLANHGFEVSSDYHGPVRARIAMVNDYYAAATQVLQQVRIDNELLTEQQFGITPSEQQVSPNLTVNELYSRRISLVDGIYAFAVFANQGIMVGQPNIGITSQGDPNNLSPTSILKVFDKNGKIWLDWSEPQSRPIISPQLAYLETNILSDENARWPSLGHPNSLEIGRPAAAKVGISDKGNDAWILGYIPQLAIGVWMGHIEEGGGGISTNVPAGLWHAITKYASNQMSVQNFIIPKGIKLVQVCDPSGLLVSELCPAIVQEAFIEGNEPSQVDTLYQKYIINRETGLLATIFTPSDMLEEKIFLVVPPHAIAWAKNAGLPIPPDTYDVIYETQPISQNVQITSPSTFDHVKGQVSIFGSAAGPAFSYYRIQVGQGLNPQQWLQIGDDINKPVKDGLLGIWDTSGLEGLYVIQLLVVRQDQRVDNYIIQVSVDNTNPQVQIVYPSNGEVLEYQPGESIMMQVSVTDNLVVAQVDFYVDNSLQSSLLEPPYIILWSPQIGDHTLLVKAYDLAGNSAESTTSFSVSK